AVLLEDVAGATRPGEALALLGEVEPGAVHEVDGGEPEPPRHLLRALDLLRGHRPPRAGGDGVVVGDDHHVAALDADERRDHARRGALEVAELPAVVDHRADLEDRRARILQQLHALTRRELALLVDPRDVALAPAGPHLLAALDEPRLARVKRGA